MRGECSERKSDHPVPVGQEAVQKVHEECSERRVTIRYQLDRKLFRRYTRNAVRGE